jgi:hypothetical protein
MQTDPSRWAPVWEGSEHLVFAAEKVLKERGIPFARVMGEAEGQIQLRVPWDEDERAREWLRGNA